MAITDCAIQDKALKLASELCGINSKDYRTDSLPGPKDEIIADLLDGYEYLPEDCRNLFGSPIDERTSFTLTAFAHGAAMLAVRTNTPKWVKQALIALMLALESRDDRDVLMMLSIVHDSAAKLDKVARVYADAAALAPNPKAASLVLGYLQRTPDDKRIEVMGFHELSGPHGLVYRFGAQPVPDGWW
jgi:hypothetical protein